MTEPRHLHQAVVLTDGSVLLIGGKVGDQKPGNTTEIFKP